ncbi:hypothetical protein DICVIV_10469 [Dictyocaulus viviparus]|uniref:Uncharacterized protein n=1 Tax=Dictyocaulus viviparus TaxID=29172 RepID=A0A0D8XIE5_DICVI|nr:hypothetical protein DICVIV_10469 [Dictyocaulus viviparus]
MIRIWMLTLLATTTFASPSPKMCAKFAKFVERWNPQPETLLLWSKDNCDKIQPRPREMTCDDVQQGPDINYPRVLDKYTYYNAATVSDYGQFGNWYYPNYFPPTYLGYFDGRPDSIAQLENDYRFARGGHYRYNRADNIVNIGLQQTSLPTCLHDLFYCIRASNPSPYQHYYTKRKAYHAKLRTPHHNTDQ